MQFGCTKHSDVFAAHFAACYCIYNFCEFKCILRIPNQNYFEHSVVHFDHFRLQLYNSRNYSRVADRAKDKLVLNRFSVDFKNSLYRTDFFECIKPFRKISKKTEHVFCVLRSRVGNIGKCAESCNISIESAVKISYINCSTNSISNISYSFIAVLWNAERVRKVVRAAGRHIAHARAFLLWKLHNAADDLVRCSVAAGTNNNFIFRTVFFYVFGCRSAVDCCKCCAGIAVIRHVFYNLRKQS